MWWWGKNLWIPWCRNTLMLQSGRSQYSGATSGYYPLVRQTCITFVPVAFMEGLLYLRDTFPSLKGVPWIDHLMYNLCTMAVIEGLLYFGDTFPSSKGVPWIDHLMYNLCTMAFIEGLLYFGDTFPSPKGVPLIDHLMYNLCTCGFHGMTPLFKGHIFLSQLVSLE